MVRGIMWSYYGSKSKVIDCYPKPKFDKIIEPFAGTARYALKYFEKDILLVDKYYAVILIWKWLQKCSIEDIKKLPNLKRGDDIRNFNFDCKEAQMLMRFMIGGGLAAPQWIVSPQGFGGGIESGKKKIINSLYKIKHWNIVHGKYDQIENQKATWFIDPPYQFGGHKYKNVAELEFNNFLMYLTKKVGKIYNYIIEESPKEPKIIKATTQNFIFCYTIYPDKKSSLEMIVLSKFKRDYDSNFLSLKVARLTGYVYFISSPYGIKIGCTYRLDQRLKTFDVKLPFKIELHSFVECPNHSKLESTLHNLLSHKRINGEWFDLNESDFIEIDLLLSNMKYKRIIHNGEKVY